MRNSEVQDLITQVSRLQLQQAELFTRVERAIDDEAHLKRDTNTGGATQHRENVADNKDRQTDRREEFQSHTKQSDQQGCLSLATESP
jgi:hypothetical protein